LLYQQGLYAGAASGIWDEATEKAFATLIGMENLEERYRGGPLVDEATLKRQFGKGLDTQ